MIWGSSCKNDLGRFRDYIVCNLFAQEHEGRVNSMLKIKILYASVCQVFQIQMLVMHINADTGNTWKSFLVWIIYTSMLHLCGISAEQCCSIGEALQVVWLGRALVYRHKHTWDLSNWAAHWALTRTCQSRWRYVVHLRSYSSLQATWPLVVRVVHQFAGNRT